MKTRESIRILDFTHGQAGPADSAAEASDRK